MIEIPTPNMASVMAITAAAQSAESDPQRALWAIAYALVYAAGKFRTSSAVLKPVAEVVVAAIDSARRVELRDRPDLSDTDVDPKGN